METAAKDMLEMRNKESEVNHLRKKPGRGDKSCYRCGNISHDTRIAQSKRVELVSLNLDNRVEARAEVLLSLLSGSARCN